MFQNLTERLTAIFDRLKNRGALTEADVDAALREVRLALLEADVNFRVVKEFLARVRERAVGADVLSSLTPGQMVVKIVLEELTALIGGARAELVLSGRIPNVIVLVGLQGSGKTTAAAKLALHLKSKGRHPLLVACDVYRPAAADQLQTLGAEIGVPVHRQDGADPVTIATQSIRVAKDRLRDVVIIDTAGRLHVDEQMMDEAARIVKAVSPDAVLMVVDAMTGQDAVNAAAAFLDRVSFDGVVITKLDGDARGGAALSVKAVTGKPIIFASTGEKLDALEPFRPDAMARRILGMGDVVGLIDKAQAAFNEEQARKAEERLKAGTFTLDDFLDQLRSVKKMGPLKDVLQMLPGAAKLPKDFEVDEGALKRTEAIITSMTKTERARPQIINGSRRQRIAAGAGVTVFEVNQVLKQYHEAQRLVKRIAAMQAQGKKGKRMPRLPGGFGFPG
ncbi:signal recognition particle GTPase [Coriobacteriaceae bacterium EMTCatB1]|nr:signal recognition particle GTPase [Coriobacteriaceae bacterium EMTCatB1]